MGRRGQRDDDAIFRGAAVGVDQQGLQRDLVIEVVGGVDRRVEDQPDACHLVHVVVDAGEAALLRDDPEGRFGHEVDRAEGDARVVGIGGVAVVARDDATRLDRERDHVAALRPEHDVDRGAVGEPDE